MLFACCVALRDHASAPVSVSVGIVASLLCAELLCRLVEEPSIRWSRAVGKAVERWSTHRSSLADHAVPALLARWKEIASPQIEAPEIFALRPRRWRQRGLRLGGAVLFLGVGVAVGRQLPPPVAGGLPLVLPEPTEIGAATTAIDFGLLPASWVKAAVIAPPVQSAPPVVKASPEWTGALSIPARDGEALPTASLPSPPVIEAKAARRTARAAPTAGQVQQTASKRRSAASDLPKRRRSGEQDESFEDTVGDTRAQ